MHKFAIVATCDQNNGIGKNGTIPWRVGKDILSYEVLISNTIDPKKHNVVVMGRKTYESIPNPYVVVQYKTVVISAKTIFKLPFVISVQSFEDALEYPYGDRVETIFIAGGGQVYADAISHPGCERIYLTRLILPNPEPCDVFFPTIDTDIYTLNGPLCSNVLTTKNGTSLRFETYDRIGCLLH